MSLLRYHRADARHPLSTNLRLEAPLDELRYMALGAAALVALALPFVPRPGFIALALLLPLVNRFIPRAGPGINASTVLLSIAVLTGLLYSRPPLPRLKVLAPLIAFYALTLISYAVMVASLDTRENADVALEAFQSLKSRLWPTLLFFAGFALAPDREMRRRIMLCLVVGLLLHSASGIYDFATGGAGADPLVSPATPLGETHRAAGVLDANPNHLGGHLGAFSILALMGMLDARRPLWLRGFFAGAYAVSGMVLILTQSRGSWLGFLVAHGVWLFYANRKLLLPAAAGGIILAVALYSSALLPESMSKRIERTLTPGSVQYSRGGIGTHFDSSVNARFAVHSTALEIFSESPIWG